MQNTNWQEIDGTFEEFEAAEKAPGDDYIRRSRYEGMHLLLLVQTIFCAAILLSVLILKIIGGPTFISVKMWYLEHANDTLISGRKTDELGQTFHKVFAPKKNKEKQTLQQPSNKAASAVENKVRLSVPLSNPVPSGVVTSPFGVREDPFTQEVCLHSGVDIGAERGTPIFATMSGVVEEADASPQRGNFVRLDHGNGVETEYLHCDELCVKKGTTVSRGETIAKVGRKGRATGDHVHVALKICGAQCDPEPYFV